DMSLAAYGRRPRQFGAHYRVIQSNRKQNLAALVSFALQAGFHLLANPIALHGALRQDQHQLIVSPDRFLDPLSEWVANLDILWRKPTVNTVLSKLGVQLPRKFVVLARVADKAGIELAPDRPFPDNVPEGCSLEHDRFQRG